MKFYYQILYFRHGMFIVKVFSNKETNSLPGAQLIDASDNNLSTSIVNLFSELKS